MANEPKIIPNRVEQVEAVLALIEAGNSERSACEQVGIDRGTFRSQALKVASATQYARATEALARDQVDKLEAVIEEMRAKAISPEIARIEIDARKWMASTLFKPTWGDKVAVDLSGGIAVAASIDVTGLTDEQVRVLASIPAQPK